MWTTNTEEKRKDMLNKDFWVATLERAVMAFAGALVAAIGTNAVSIININWEQALGLSATVALVTVLTSIASSGFGKAGPALFGPETIAPDTVVVETTRDENGKFTS